MARILLIEDEEILQRMYQKLLVSKGYEVLEAKDGRTGLTLSQTKKPDLIILDIMLPGGLSGFDVLEQLKKDELTKDIMVLVLTNLPSEEKMAITMGASRYLVKVNTKPDQVLDVVTELLSTKEKNYG